MRTASGFPSTSTSSPESRRTSSSATATSSSCPKGHEEVPAMAEETGKESGLSGALAIWRRRKWLAVLAFAVPASAAVSLIVFLPNVYRSAATVLVESQQVPESLVPPTVTSTLETRLQTISQEILSRSKLEALIDRFVLYPDLRQRLPFEEVVDHMRKDVKLELKGVDVKGVRQATVAFTISYQGGDPGKVAAVANTLASFYIEENLKVRERLATGTAEFLEVQVSETKTRLDDLERRVGEFKRRHLGELPQQMEQNLASLERLNTQLRVNADNQTRAFERRQALSSQLAEAETLLGAPGALGTPALSAGGAAPELPPAVRLAQMKQKLAELSGQFSDKYPDVVQLKKQITALEREIAADAQARGSKDEPNGDRKAAPAPATPLTPYVLRLKEALSEAEGDMKVFKGEERRLKESIGTLYQSLLKRKEEARLAESLEQRQKGEQFRLLDRAIPGRTPDAPKRGKLLLLALIGSIGLAVGAVLLAEHVDTSFHSIEDIRAFSPVPVLVSIPRIVTETDRRGRRWRMRLAAGFAVIGLVVIVGSAYFIAHGNERLVLLMGRSGS